MESANVGSEFIRGGSRRVFKTLKDFVGLLILVVRGFDWYVDGEVREIWVNCLLAGVLFRCGFPL